MPNEVLRVVRVVASSASVWSSAVMIAIVPATIATATAPIASVVLPITEHDDERINNVQQREGIQQGHRAKADEHCWLCGAA